MKHLPSMLVLICTALIASLPLIAENLDEVVDEAEKAINQKYPNEASIAHRLKIKELEDIVFSDKSEEEKIAAIRAKYPSTSSLKLPTESEQSNDLSSLVFRPPLQWQIQSIEIAYDIDSVTTLLFSAESLYQEGSSKNREDSKGESDVTRINAGSKTQLDVDVGGEFSIKGWNPLDWFKAKAGFQWVTSGNAGIDYTKTKSSQWNERAQRALSNNYEEKARILQDTRIAKCHLTFYILFKNNTNKDLFLNPQEFSVPVYAGENRPLADAFPDKPLRSFRIPRNAYANLKFRAELNTTSALDLIKYMRTSEPMIRLDRAQSTIASSDDSIQDAVQESLQVETVPFRCRAMVLQIKKFNQDKPVTVAEAMRALNAVFEKPPFGFNNDDCVSLTGIPLLNNENTAVDIHQFPIVGINGVYTSATIPATQLNRPISQEGIFVDVLDIAEEETWTEASPKLQALFVPFLKNAAESGDAIACCQLGDCYYFGKGVKNDYGEAVKWYQKAAEQGNSLAQFKLSICYKNGYGCKQDITKAAQYCRMSAERGKPEAQYELGNYYYLGSGVNKNFNEAFSWYRKAAEQNFANAQCALGDCYYYGAGVERNYSIAIEWFSKAANQGHDIAQSRLENLLTSIQNGSQQQVRNQTATQAIRADVNTISNIKGRFPEEYKAAQRIRNSNPAAYRNMMHELHRRLNTNR